MSLSDTLERARDARILLNSLLQQDPDQLMAIQQSELVAKAPEGTDTIIVFGAGGFGRLTAARLRQSGKYKVYLSDNKLGGTVTELDGIPMLPPDQAFERYASSAIFVAAILTVSPLLEQLQAAGCLCSVSAATLYRGLRGIIPPYFCMSPPKQIFDERDQVLAAFDLMADDESREEFFDLIRWHTSEAYFNLPRRHNSDQTYFAPDLVQPVAGERIVDCGAYDGDIIRTLIEHPEWDIAGLAAFEPDAGNFDSLQKYVSSLPPPLSERINIFPYALGATEGEVSFSSTGNMAASVSETGDIVVRRVAMDDILGSYHPTFIKMDIEGAEPDAIRGAQNILQSDAPLLAITLYHELNHLWHIPLLINSINPDYRIYLRRYSEDGWETVCYAVPAGGPARLSR